MTDSREQKLTVPFASWYADRELELTFPEGWQLHLAAPTDAPEISDTQISSAYDNPIATATIAELARNKKTVAIAVDDLTRPTPVHRFLPQLIDRLLAVGIDAQNIRIIMGTASHRPMEPHEIRLKLGEDLAARFPPVVHNFVGPDIRFIGWIHGGPVHLNRHFLDADLRILVGGVIPHGETGFGGGAKMLIPGLAGRLTIAHFHGARPERLAGEIEFKEPGLDRRGWAEAVAKEIGVHLTVCAVMNSRRQLAGLHVGDVVQAHRSAARQALALGLTFLPEGWQGHTDIAIVNAYPLDTDPIQMGKSIDIARRTGVKATVILNAASDGIFYHGMGMGSGISKARLFKNVPGLLTSPTSLWSYLRSLTIGVRYPGLAARLSYFTLNHLAYATFVQQRHPSGTVAVQPAIDTAADPLVYSEKFPEWGFKQKYTKGRLFRTWSALLQTLTKRFGDKARVVVFPCAPLQLLDDERLRRCAQ